MKKGIDQIQLRHKLNIQMFAGPNRLQEIEARRSEIRGLLESGQEVDIDALDTELRALNGEKTQIEKRSALAASIAAGTAVATPIPVPAAVPQQRSFENMNKDELLSTPEYRSAYLKNLQGKRLNDAEERALTTGSGATAAVPTTTLNMIIDKLRQVSVLFPRINVTYIPGNLSLVIANAKNAAAWKTEGADGTPADDTVVAVNLGGYELIKLVEISAAASAMTIDAFEAYIAAELGRQMSIALENAILNGTGSGQPTGILSGITWDTTNNVEWTLNGSVGYDDIVDGLALLPTMYHNTAAFVMNRKMVFNGIRKIKDTQNHPLFTYNPQDAAAMKILGYPVIMDDYVPDNTILLGDLGYYYMNFSQPVELSASREAGFKSGKITYRGLAVTDGKPALAEAFIKISESAT